MILLDVFLCMYFGILESRPIFEWKVLGFCFCGIFFSFSSSSMLPCLFGFVVDSIRRHWPARNLTGQGVSVVRFSERLEIHPPSQRASWLIELHWQVFPGSECSFSQLLAEVSTSLHVCGSLPGLVISSAPESSSPAF